MAVSSLDRVNAPDAKASHPDVVGLMADIGKRARAASRALALSPASARNGALTAMARAIRDDEQAILAANATDLAAAHEAGFTAALIDRLTLTPARVEGIATAIDEIVALSDPIGQVISAWERPNGLQIERVRVPLGVIGVIYESRPNVTADAGALCLKAGNAVVLRGGSDSFNSSTAIHAALVRGLAEAGLPEHAVQYVPTRDRAAVGAMLAGLDGNLDVIVPRGGKSLVARVQDEARVPVFAHLDGNVHIYVHGSYDIEAARTVIRNAKLRRTGVCGAVETLLVDRALAASHLTPLVSMLLDAGCAVRGDDAVQAVDPRVTPATTEDWATEFLDAIIAVKVVAGLDEAIDHIARYGSHHTDAILTDDTTASERFLREVDSAIVIVNASTQFADGGEFGFGGEIGIATGRFHARGPVGVEQLTSFNYRIRGAGQTRP
jgi:glutamate-5-semialdehyde dehydrogenase